MIPPWIWFAPISLFGGNDTLISFSNPLGSNITLNYNIKDCQKPLTDFASCFLQCNLTNIDQFLSCTAKVAQCYNEVYQAMVEANRTLIRNETNTINITKEVPVLAYDPNITSLLGEHYQSVSSK